MLGLYLSCLTLMVFLKECFKKVDFENAIRVSNNLDPDQALHFGSKPFAEVISR